MDENLKKRVIKKDKTSWLVEEYVNDVVLGSGLAYVIEKRELAEEGTFFIVEGGMPHLPFMASVLRNYGVEPFLWLEERKDVDPRDYYSNFEYFGESYSNLKEGTLLARVFDTHSKVNRDEHTPSFRELKRKGIKRVAILLEGNLTLNEFYNTESEFEKMFSGERESLKGVYERFSNHFEMLAYEIDPRTSKHGYESMVTFVENNEDYMEFLWEVWGKENVKRDRLIGILESFGKRWFD
jgi:hypothetical protein